MIAKNTAVFRFPGVWVRGHDGGRLIVERSELKYKALQVFNNFATSLGHFRPDQTGKVRGPGCFQELKGLTSLFVSPQMETWVPKLFRAGA
jgi:hypothetical protein